MATVSEYALFADLAYRDIRDRDENSPVIPPGWSPVERLLPMADPDRPGHYGGPAPFNPSGFSADVFSKGNEIVISYGGTNPVKDSTDGSADWSTNVRLIGGSGSLPEQLIQAVQLYIAVRRANRDKNVRITLTGHSLGGGLASLVGVMFDVPATLFASAPFESTIYYQRLVELDAVLRAWGATSTELENFTLLKNQLPEEGINPTFSAEFVRRELNIVSHYIQGEAVDWFRGPWTTVMNPVERPIAVGREGMGAVDLHSMHLHAAILASEAFRRTSLQLPTLISLVRDESLYARKLQNGEKDFLQRLMEYQIGTPTIQANGMLDRFAVDVRQVARSNLKERNRGQSEVSLNRCSANA